MGEDVGEGLVFEKAEGFVVGEAGFASGADGSVPDTGGGGTGQAAEEAGELARGAEGGVFLLEKGLDEFEFGLLKAEFGMGRN